MFTFFGHDGSYLITTIEKLNVSHFLNGNSADWNIFQLPGIHHRCRTLAAPISDNEIAIIGGQGAAKEVLILNTHSSSFMKAV